MYVQSTDNSFRAKNTYLNLAEKALTKDDKKKFLSYHYEAKARAHHLRFLKEESKLKLRSDKKSSTKTFSVKDWFNLIKTYLKIGYEKLASLDSMSYSYRYYPGRFDKTV